MIAKRGWSRIFRPLLGAIVELVVFVGIVALIIWAVLFS